VTITVDALTGYVQRDLDADLARWFPASDPAEVGDEARPVGPFLDRLPPAAAAALAAFDQRVRAGRVPEALDIADWSYGFDFAGNGCGILDSDYETELSDDVFSIGADGGGNYYVVLTNGQVAVWFHEEEVIEADTRFDNLDVFVWSLVRYHAVRSGALALADVEDDFVALGQDGAVGSDLGMLAMMKARSGS
jgi:hypothetical protein